MKIYTLPFKNLSWDDVKRIWNDANRRRGLGEIAPARLAALQKAFDTVQCVFDEHEPTPGTRFVLKSEGREAKGVFRQMAESDNKAPIQTPGDIADGLLLFFEEIGAEGAPEPQAAYHAMRAILEWEGAQSAIDRGEATGAGLAGFAAGVSLGLSYLNEHAGASEHAYKIRYARHSAFPEWFFLKWGTAAMEAEGEELSQSGSRKAAGSRRNALLKHPDLVLDVAANDARRKVKGLESAGRPDARTLKNWADAVRSGKL